MNEFVSNKVADPPLSAAKQQAELDAAIGEQWEHERSPRFVERLNSLLWEFLPGTMTLDQAETLKVDIYNKVRDANFGAAANQ